MKQKVFSILALLLMAVSGAWAQTETLLTTITATAKEQASYSTANVATVSFSYTAYGSSAYAANWGWWGYGWSATVTAAEGYTITKCIFYDDANRTATDSEDPFVVETTEEDKTPQVNGTPILAYTSKGIKKIEVYGYATPVATDYSVTLPEGTEDAENWTISDGTNSAKGNVGLAGLTGDGTETVTITYNGTKRVKSVTAVEKAAVLVTGITLNKTETSIKVGSTETLSVTAVAPDNATDKTYTWKTSDETKATVDQDGKVTAVAAGTVTIYAEANDGSGVKGNCTVTVTPATITVTWNNSDISSSGTSFTKDGVTMNVTGILCDFFSKNFSGGTFTSTVGNFTKIEVTAESFGTMGSGWSVSSGKATWTGTASSTVSFGGSGNMDGIWGMGNTKFVFTIEPTN